MIHTARSLGQFDGEVRRAAESLQIEMWEPASQRWYSPCVGNTPPGRLKRARS